MREVNVWLAVALGGLAGSLARHGVNLVFGHAFTRPVPYATASVNLVGSFVVGMMAAWAVSGRLPNSSALRAFIFTGLLGGFTTFSSFMLDTLTLTESGARPLAAANLAGQLVLGVAAVFLGYYSAR